MSNLYIITTDHRDQIHGPKKLLTLYDRIHPDILLSEINEEDLQKFTNFCRNLMARLRQLTPDQKGVDDFMNIFTMSSGFEYYANEEYAQNYGISNHMVDMPGGQSKFYSQLEQTMEMVLKQAKYNGGVDIQKWIRKFKERSAKSPEEVRKSWETFTQFEGTPEGETILLLASVTTGRIGKQDEYMEERIRGLYDPNKVIAFPVGMLHALESMFKKIFYSRIKDLKVKIKD